MKKIALILALSAVSVGIAHAKDITAAKSAVNKAITDITNYNLDGTEKNVETALDYLPWTNPATKEYLDLALIKIRLAKDLYPVRFGGSEAEAVRKEIRQLLYNAWDSLRK